MATWCSTMSESDLRATVIKAIEDGDIDHLEDILKEDTSTDSTFLAATRVPNTDFWSIFKTVFLKLQCIEQLPLPCENLVMCWQQKCNLLAYAIQQIGDASKMSQCVRLIVEHLSPSILNVDATVAIELDTSAAATVNAYNAARAASENALSKKSECETAGVSASEIVTPQPSEMSPLVALILRAQRDKFQGSDMRNTFDFLLASGADITYHSPSNCNKSPDAAVCAAITRNPAVLYAILSTGKVNVVHLAEDFELYAIDEVGTTADQLDLYDKYIMKALIGSALAVMCCISGMDGGVLASLKRITEESVYFQDVPGTFDTFKQFLPTQVTTLKQKCRSIIRLRLTEGGSVSAAGSLQAAAAALPIPESQKSYITEEQGSDGRALANVLRLRLTKATHKRKPGALQENDCFFGEDTVIDNIADDASDYETSDDDYSGSDYDFDD